MISTVLLIINGLFITFAPEKYFKTPLEGLKGLNEVFKCRCTGGNGQKFILVLIRVSVPINIQSI